MKTVAIIHDVPTVATRRSLLVRPEAEGAHHPEDARRHQVRTVPKRASVSSVGWAPNVELEFDSWVIEGRRIGSMTRSSPWWLGDWLVYGTAKWGERYSLAARVTGYDVKTLRNIRYIAASIPSSLRRDDLSWSHHALLAALGPEEQQHWLERACVDRLSVEDLRIELRSMKRGRYRKHGEGLRIVPEGSNQVSYIDCPRCGSQVPLPSEHR